MVAAYKTKDRTGYVVYSGSVGPHSSLLNSESPQTRWMGRVVHGASDVSDLQACNQCLCGVRV
jgi:hypothetical protein